MLVQHERKPENMKHETQLTWNIEHKHKHEHEILCMLNR
jgi:hypothetical protein